MPGMWCSSWAVPVTIEAAHTGVTEGNAATQSGMYVPRSHQRRQHGRGPGLGGAHEHLGRHRVDHAEHELGGMRLLTVGGDRGVAVGG